jgi:hypothetical protein
VAGSWPDLMLVRSGRTPRAMAKALDPRGAPRCIAGIYLVFTKVHAAVQNDDVHSRMLDLLGRLVPSSAYFLGSIARIEYGMECGKVPPMGCSCIK